MRTMLSICDAFASFHGLKFNASKTQLIYFRTRSIHPIIPKILFNDTPLCYSDRTRVVHLGHFFTYNLDDRQDVIRVVKEMNCKANSILCTLKWADPFIKCKILLSVFVWLGPVVIIIYIN